MLKWLASLGVGGVLAGVVLIFYRRDFLRERNGYQTREDRMIRALEQHAAATEKLAAVAGMLDSLPGKLEHCLRNAMQQCLLECRLRERER